MDEDLVNVQPVTSWIFKTEYTLYLGLSALNTIITLYWIRHGIFGSITSTRSRLFMTISIIGSLLYNYVYAGFLTFKILDIYTLDEIKRSCVVQLILNIPWAINRTFLYLYFLWRVDAVFGQSIFKLKKSIITTLSIALCAMFVFASLFMYGYGEIIGCQASIDGLLSSMLLVVTDALFAWTCLYLFASRLRKTIKMIEANSEEESPKMAHLQYTANKLTILQVVTIIFTMFISVFFLFIPITAVIGIDTTVNAVCLILSVKSYDAYYRKMCSICRQCCENGYERRSEYKAKKLKVEHTIAMSQTDSQS